MRFHAREEEEEGRLGNLKMLRFRTKMACARWASVRHIARVLERSTKHFMSFFFFFSLFFCPFCFYSELSMAKHCVDIPNVHYIFASEHHVLFSIAIYSIGDKGAH